MITDNYMCLSIHLDCLYLILFMLDINSTCNQSMTKKMGHRGILYDIRGYYMILYSSPVRTTLVIRKSLSMPIAHTNNSSKFDDKIESKAVAF